MILKLPIYGPARFSRSALESLVFTGYNVSFGTTGNATTQKSLLRAYFHHYHHYLFTFFDGTEIRGYSQEIRGYSLECPGLLMPMRLSMCVCVCV